MSFIRDFSLTSLGAGETKKFAAVGRVVVIRRADNAGRVKIKAYSKDGGELLISSAMDAGEKIISDSRFTLVEVTNLEVDSRDVLITCGDGDFQSDVVEGEVTVKTDSSNPIAVQPAPTKTELAKVTVIASGTTMTVTNESSVAFVSESDFYLTIDAPANTDHLIKAGTFIGFPVQAGQTITFKPDSTNTIYISKYSQVP